MRGIAVRPPYLPPEVYPQTYQMSFLSTVGLRDFPIKGCRGWSTMRKALKVHLCHRHVRNTMIFLE